MTAEQAEQRGGHMNAADMQYHVKTWNGFMSFIKWGLISSLVIMAILAIFRT